MAARYEILEVIGSGGCAHVVRAHRLRDPPGSPDVALKVVRPELAADAGVLRRFRDEAHILEAVQHRFVVHAHELLDYDGRLVLEMEFVEGATLEKALGALGPVPIAVAAGVVRQAATALLHAWDVPGADGRPMRIVHRDLKPANLALSVQGRMKLLDFGYAKGDFEGRAAQSLHDVWGTIGFDAPERKQGLTTPAADVYALGVTFYVALTTRAMLLSMKEAHHDEDLEGALEHLKDLDGVEADGIRALVRDCMHFDPERRVTLEQLVARVDALVGAEVGERALAEYCATEVVELWRDRMVVSAQHDEAWPELEFLELRGPTPKMEALTREAGRGRLEQILGTPGWYERIAEVDPVLDATVDVDPAPLLAVIERARVPFWKPWEKAEKPEAVEAALLLLVRVNPALAEQRGRALRDHPNPRVREAARYVSGGD